MELIMISAWQAFIQWEKAVMKFDVGGNKTIIIRVQYFDLNDMIWIYWKPYQIAPLSSL